MSLCCSHFAQAIASTRHPFNYAKVKQITLYFVSGMLLKMASKISGSISDKGWCENCERTVSVLVVALYEYMKVNVLNQCVAHSLFFFKIFSNKTKPSFFIFVCFISLKGMI